MIEIYTVNRTSATISEDINFIHSCWGNENNRNFYQDCILNSGNTSDGLPEFYIARSKKSGEIAGCCALLRNDLISRQDLYPWLACLFVVKEYRNQLIGKQLIAFTIERAEKLGFRDLYLCTDHDSYYEKYNWDFFTNGYSSRGEHGRIYKFKIIK